MKRISLYTHYRANDQHHADWKPTRIGPKSSHTLDLQLPHGAKLYSVGLDLPLDLPMPAWEALGAPLALMGSGIQWALGDWWAYGDHSYAARRNAVKAAAQSIPYDYDSLMNLGYVARQVHISLRNENLSFSHHVAVAPLDAKQQAKCLDMAARSGWTVKRLRRYIGGDRAIWDLISQYPDASMVMMELGVLSRGAEDARPTRFMNVPPWDQSWIDHAGEAEIARLIGEVETTIGAWSEFACGLKRYQDGRAAKGHSFVPRPLRREVEGSNVTRAHKCPDG